MKLGKMGMIAATLGLMGMGAMTGINNGMPLAEKVSKKDNSGKQNRNNQQPQNEAAKVKKIVRNDIFEPSPVIYDSNSRGPKEWGMYLQSNRKQKWSKKRKS